MAMNARRIILAVLIPAAAALRRWGRGIARACRWRRDGAVIPGRKRGLSAVIPHRATMRRSGLLVARSEEHTSELQSLTNLVGRLLLAKKNIVAVDHEDGRVQRFRDG